jgi:tetratricopeptide (TPR) repeat protein
MAATFSSMRRTRCKQFICKRDYARALEINAWLHERFPDNPIGLYHRALILEKLDRPQEALAVWEKLIARIQAFQKPSDGFLAECHWRRAQIYVLEKDSAKSAAELRLASQHIQQRDEAEELEGPLVSFQEIKKAIGPMQKK